MEEYKENEEEETRIGEGRRREMKRRKGKQELEWVEKRMGGKRIRSRG